MPGTGGGDEIKIDEKHAKNTLRLVLSGEVWSLK